MVNFVNEVPNTALTDNVLKYTLTKEDNTTELVQIDLATPLQVVGTPLNKATFDSIKTHLDLIGKYNTPTISSSASVTSGNYIPTYTSATNPTGFEVTASSNTTTAWRNLDNNDNTMWTPASQDTNPWWQIKLDTSIWINQISIVVSNTAGGTKYPVLQGSADGTTFADIYTMSVPQSSSRQTISFNIPASPLYQYYRVVYNSTIGIATFQIKKWYIASAMNMYTLNNNLASLDKGQIAKILIPSAYKGGNIQLNINNLGYKNITLESGVGYSPDEPLTLWYNGTSFQIDG